jgi:hypothetical protein
VFNVPINSFMAGDLYTGATQSPCPLAVRLAARDWLSWLVIFILEPPSLRALLQCDWLRVIGCAASSC